MTCNYSRISKDDFPEFNLFYKLCKNDLCENTLDIIFNYYYSSLEKYRNYYFNYFRKYRNYFDIYRYSKFPNEKKMYYI